VVGHDHENVVVGCNEKEKKKKERRGRNESIHIIQVIMNGWRWHLTQELN